MSKKSNEHIEEYLKWYIGEACKEPHFAVLIKGGWGSGKTYFIKDFIKSNGNETIKEKVSESKFLYLSLYGLDSLDDIDRQIFQQLHPKLGSKKAVLAGSLFKSVITKRIGDLSDTKLIDFLKNFGDKILVLDDLERCNIQIEKVLGYINSLVEHQYKKVIIVANDKEIESGLTDVDKKNDSRYHQIKEKVIGKTFKIKSDIPMVINSLINENAQNGKDVLVLNKNILIEIFETVKNKTEKKHANYRAFSHAIKDFEYVMVKIDSKYTGHAKFMSDYLNIFMRLAYELQLGQITEEDISNVKAFEYINKFGGLFSENQNTAHEETNKNYIAIADFFDRHKLNSSDIILQPNIWAQILCEAIINFKEIYECFDNNKYFITKARADWVNLWHYMDLEDDCAEKLIKKIDNNLDKHTYENSGVILHIYGSLLDLHKKRFQLPETIGNTPEQIKEHAKKYIDHLYKKNLLPNRIDKAKGYMDVGYGGLGYNSSKSECFKSIRDYFFGKCREKQLQLTQEQTEDLLKTMIIAPREFYWLIASSDSNSNEEQLNYWNVPIFQNIDPQRFVDEYIKIPNTDKNMINSTFKERYQHINSNPYLKEEFPEFAEELDFMKQVSNLINVTINNSEPTTPTIYHLNTFKDSCLKFVIEELEKFVELKS